jgi:hypothetical protein
MASDGIWKEYHQEVMGKAQIEEQGHLPLLTRTW